MRPRALALLLVTIEPARAPFCNGKYMREAILLRLPLAMSMAQTTLELAVGGDFTLVREVVEIYCRCSTRF